MLSLYFVLLWLLWVSGAMALFWIVALAVGVPAAIRLTDRSVNHILRPPGHEEAIPGPPSVAVVCLERGLRSLIIIGAIAWLGHFWEIDVDLMNRDTMVTRVVRGAVMASILVLIADFLWNMSRPRSIQSSRGWLAGRAIHRGGPKTRAPAHLVADPAQHVVRSDRRHRGTDGAILARGRNRASDRQRRRGRRRYRLRCPDAGERRDQRRLYLLDDAFRVGEYIQSGNYRGVVESFSLRSVKLRQQNGPLFTVPFGVLGAVQNMSRDWAIEKLTIGVTYDTDIDKARKIIKKVGQELKADPELAAGILEPLKMQGVQASAISPSSYA